MNKKDVFEKFTESARAVLRLAQDEAFRRRATYIGTEHILLGLVRENDSAALKVLRTFGIDPLTVYMATERTLNRSNQIIPEEFRLTPGAKQTIRLAVQEARQYKHRYIGSEHLLLGLICEREGIASRVLESLGVTLEQARVQTSQVLSNL